MQTCGDIVNGISDQVLLDQFIGEREIRLTTKNNYKYSLKDAFTLTMRLKASGATDSFWDNCALDSKIYVWFKLKCFHFVRNNSSIYSFLFEMLE